MKLGQFVCVRQLVVDLGAIFHRACTLPNVDVQVHTQVFLRDAIIVAQNVDL
jgi:hypothetical protein